ncbi:hypothetical protein DRV85_15995 [Rhodosalinus halophilus]|uniref:Uncharacterized protein n=1 Tax=Rhodosalinus halophilus TaxID=2259333 RepID=A0A365U730_9RHOB|nr:glycosyltransferase family 4 protein [Rhodosalinus halophilus]RBI83314.1 hypothetical protein DRV85_15995 [Rhodosalinus halophilus]
MKLLILSRYDRQGASSRLRTRQYIPYLEAAGFSVDIHPLFDAAYLDSLYNGRRDPVSILRAYSRRVRRLRSANAFDVIWLEKELLPWLPWGAERFFSPDGPAIVSDYDDALFHRYDRHPSGAIRRILGDKIAKVMRGSDLVLAGNRYLADYAAQAGSPWVEIVPTVVDCSVYGPRKPRRTSGVAIGWIGTPGTWSDCVAPFLEPLKGIVDGEAVSFLAVGAGSAAGTAEGFEVRSWSEAREVADIQDMDIGIMPLPDTPWMRGKCGYKLIQYMACGLPVVASPVGVNSEIVEHGVNGFLASSEAEWVQALETLIAEPELRRRMGAAGRRKVEDAYSLQVHGPRVARLLAEVARGGKAR